jgi:hypothetical protein
MRSPPGEILVKHRFPDIAAGPLDERQQRVTSQVSAGRRGQLIGRFRILLNAPGVEAVPEIPLRVGSRGLRARNHAEPPEATFR